MLRTRLHRPALAGLVMLLAVAISTPRVHADWDDRSGSLPGISGIGSIVVLAGALVGGLFLLRHVGGKDALRAMPSRVALTPSSSDASVRLVNRSRKPIRVLRVDPPAGDAFSLDPQAAVLPITLQPEQTLEMHVRLVSRAVGRYGGDVLVLASDERERTERLRVRVEGRVREADAASAAAR